MDNNELFRSLRDALALDTAAMAEIFRAAGRQVDESALAAFLRTADEDDYIPCANPIMGFFLDGLIIQRRGRQEGSPAVAAPQAELGNNAILKKLRIALDLKEDDLIALFAAAGLVLTKHELTALFRKPGHKHYKVCSDQQLRSFISGVALRSQS